MKSNLEITNGKFGMNRDKHPSTLSPNEYTVAFNTNLSSQEGEGFPMLQNEQSNLLCVDFPEGYKVMSYKKHPNKNLTYFILTNPTTLNSQIGYIEDVGKVEETSDKELSCKCKFIRTLDEPLECQEQTPICEYKILLEDDCNQCLNLQVCHPISGMEIKVEECGTTLWFTDGFNPQRYLNLDELDEYKLVGRETCDDDGCLVERSETCLDCEKLNIFQKYIRPCIKVETIQYGGRLKMGTYEALVSLTDSQGNELTEYYSITDVIPIFDKNNLIMTQPDLDNVTNKGIRFKVSGLDNRFSHYKVAIIYTSGLDGAQSYFIEGVHPISDDTVYLTTDSGKEKTTLQKLTNVRTYYKTAKILATSNGQLFQGGLTVERDYNLQPIANLLGGFLNWQTSIAKEGIYCEEKGSATHKGYMRGEVYPFSIRFHSTIGKWTPWYFLTGRPPIGIDDELIDSNLNADVESINSYAQDCSEITRDRRWQYYDTSSKIPEICPLPDNAGGYSEVLKQYVENCIVPDVGCESAVTFQAPEEDFVDLWQYMSDFEDDICNPSSTRYNSQLCQLLQGDYGSANCALCTDTVLDGCGLYYDASSCSTPVKVPGSETLLLGSVENLVISGIPKDKGDYEFSNPSTGQVYQLDNSGNYIEDVPFQDTYLGGTGTAYKRYYSNINNSCGNAQVLDLLIPNFQSYVFNYQGGDNLADIQTNKSSTYSDSEFSSNVHVGALWFEVDFNGEDFIILEIPPRNSCTTPDTVSTSDNVRYSIFESCSDTMSVDANTVNLDSGGIICLNRDDFNSDIIRVALDMPYRVYAGNYIVNGSCSSLSVIRREIEYVGYEITADKICVSKSEDYEFECTFRVLDLGNCDSVPFEKGYMGYYESLEKFPCNPELYDSSTLNVSLEQLPESIRDKFSEFYMGGGTTITPTNTDLCNKPIRIPRIPDNCKVPFIGEDSLLPFDEPYVYIMGVTLDNEVINSFLDIAVTNGLLSQEERNNIVGYEIARGDRTLHRSVIAKGLMYDVYKYKEGSEDWYYPNYPYNDLGVDTFSFADANRTGKITHPFDGVSNDKFTFHSPDTHFYKPNIPSELNIEGYQFGHSRGRFTDVERHPEWVVLGSGSFNASNVLAGAELAFEIAISIGELLVNANTGGIAGVIQANVFATVAVVASTIVQSVFRFGELRYKWLQVFKQNGTPRNLASYYSSEGWYNKFQPNCEEGDILRGLANTKYLESGNHRMVTPGNGEEVRFNNTFRESSLYLSTGDFPVNYPTNYLFYDNSQLNPNNTSRFTASQSGLCQKGRTDEVVRNIASPYVSLKQYQQSQYGKVNSIKWIPTGYCGDLSEDNKCHTIFGGDIFISRMTLKRKHPHFYTNAVGLADLTPYEYYSQRNVGYPAYYVDYEIDDSSGLGGALFPVISSNYNLDCRTGVFYLRPPSKFYLFNYGIPQFLVESEINLNFRYGRNNTDENFYPNVSDYTNWTQEDNVSIKRDNSYFYNNVYSKSITRLSNYMLPESYDREKFECLNNAPNRVIVSQQDVTEQSLVEPWLNYKPLDFKDFSTKYGRLIDIRSIESQQVLVRFENQIVIFNAIDSLRDRLTIDNSSLGNGGVFSSSRPITFAETDLGYAGSQHRAMVSCEFGHYFTDAKRGKVFELKPNGEGLRDIGQGLSSWFKEHLPFKILCQGIVGLEEEHTDNVMCGLGIAMGWDSQYSRVFLTKRDYKLKPAYKGLVTFDGCDFIYNGDIIQLDNSNVFEDCSWTVAYNPLLQGVEGMMSGWISYYSFKPNYYIPHYNWFQTGINSLTGSSLWSHLLTKRSYQVFYGKKYGWLVEQVVKNDLVNKMLKSVNYWMDTKRYHSDYEFAEKRDIGFNKAWIYNHSQNSGLLELITQNRNDVSQEHDYPKFFDFGEEILASQSNKWWRFNYFFNRVDNEYSNVPIWNVDCNNIGKWINKNALNYTRIPYERMAGDWFLLRLVQDKETRFSQILKWTVIQDNINPNG